MERGRVESMEQQAHLEVPYNQKNGRKQIPEEVLALPTANAHVMKRDVEPLLAKVPAGESPRRFYKKPSMLFEEVQLERMWAFAENLRWQMDRERSAEIDNFCREIMVPKNIFRAWLHNHKPWLASRMASMAPEGGASDVKSYDNSSSTKLKN